MRLHHASPFPGLPWRKQTRPLPLTKFKVWVDGNGMRSDGHDAKRGDFVSLTCFLSCVPSVDVLVGTGVSWNGTEIKLFPAGTRKDAVGTTEASQEGNKINTRLTPVRPGFYDLTWAYRGHPIGEQRNIRIEASGTIAEIDLRNVLFPYTIEIALPKNLRESIAGTLFWRPAGSDGKWQPLDFSKHKLEFSATAPDIDVRLFAKGHREESRTLARGKHTFTLRPGLRVRLVLRTTGRIPAHPYIFDPAPCVDGREVGEIGLGHLLLVGFTGGDSTDEAEWMADRVVGLRVFNDADGKMNRDLEDVGGSLLVVSQFTLYGDTRKGRRPSFVHAAPPEIAIPLYERFVEILEARLPGRVATGEFGAMMDVSLVNDGPVTLVLER